LPQSSKAVVVGHST